MKNEKIRITKIVKLGKRSQMVLPKEVRDWLGVEEGQSVIFQIGEDGVKVLTPAQFAESTRGVLKGLWGENPMKYLKEERESWEKRF